VAALLLAGALAYTEPGKPRGCLIVLAASTYTAKTVGIRDHLAERRRALHARLTQRLDRAVAEGELPEGADTALLTRYATTVLNGMSTQARDGASRAELLAVADAAMLSWDRLAAGEGARPEAGATR
jgi:hypothetical protein